MKCVFFVEGQTELVLVRELLLQIHSWNAVIIECFNLVRNDLERAEYTYKSDSADYEYLIINVGNDNRAQKVIPNRIEGMRSQGYTKFICLRDAYSEYYKVRTQEVNNEEVIEEIRNQFFDALAFKNVSFDDIEFFVAIMETESWFLAMTKLPECIDSSLTHERIFNEQGIDLLSLDPENAFYHPANTLNSIYEIVGSQYDKKIHTVSGLITQFTIDDFNELRDGNKCSSFNSFFDSIIRE